MTPHKCDMSIFDEFAKLHEINKICDTCLKRMVDELADKINHSWKVLDFYMSKLGSYKKMTPSKDDMQEFDSLFHECFTHMHAMIMNQQKAIHCLNEIAGRLVKEKK